MRWLLQSVEQPGPSILPTAALHQPVLSSELTFTASDYLAVETSSLNCSSNHAVFGTAQRRANLLTRVEFPFERTGVPPTTV